MRRIRPVPVNLDAPHFAALDDPTVECASAAAIVLQSIRYGKFYGAYPYDFPDALTGPAMLDRLIDVPRGRPGGRFLSAGKFRRPTDRRKLSA